MGCNKLQLQDYFQLVENGLTKYCGARFNTNEPAVTRGNPILASRQGAKTQSILFNDMLGTTLGIAASKGKKSFVSTATTAFGEAVNTPLGVTRFFTGKPHVEGLGYAFLFRNYRANLGKWTTADPLGYPDGWNNLAYGNNAVTNGFDKLGGVWGTSEMTDYYYRTVGPDYLDTDTMGLTSATWAAINNSLNDIINKVKTQITAKVEGLVKVASLDTGTNTTVYSTSNVYNFYSVCYAFGMGAVFTTSSITFSWLPSDDYTGRYFGWSSTTSVSYQDSYQDPLDIGIEFGNPYGFGHVWSVMLSGSGYVAE